MTVSNARHLSDDEVRERTLAFVNDVLALFNTPPVDHLLAGKVGVPSMCPIAMTLNVATGTVPAFVADRDAHLAGETGERMTDEQMQRAVENLFLIGEDASTLIRRMNFQSMPENSITRPLPHDVQEFIRRFDAETAFADLVLVTGEESKQLRREYDEATA